MLIMLLIIFSNNEFDRNRMKDKSNSIHEVPRFKPFDYGKKSVDLNRKEGIYELFESSKDADNSLLNNVSVTYQRLDLTNHQKILMT